MKNNLVLGVLVGLLGVGTVMTAVLSFRVVTASRTWNRLQLNILVTRNNSVAAQNLMNELVEYGRTHPSIEPLLSQLRNKTNAVAQPTNR